MKLNYKIYITLLFTTLTQAVLLGGLFYGIVSFLISDGILEKQEQIISIVADHFESIEFESECPLNTKDDIENLTDYQNYLSKINKRDENIAYLYLLRLCPEDGYFHYLLDGNVSEYDEVIVESEEVKFVLFSRSNQMMMKYNENEFSFPAEIKISGYNIKIVNFAQSYHVYYDHHKILSFSTNGMDWVWTPEGFLSVTDPQKIINLRIGDGYQEIFIDFHPRGEVDHIPGEIFVESPDILHQMEEVYRSGSDMYYKVSADESVLGQDMFCYYNTIKNDQGKTEALLVSILTDDTLKNLRASLFGITALVTLILFVIIYAISVFLGRMMIRPIDFFIKGFQKLSAGDFSAEINIKRKDEYGIMAKGFNQMAASLHQYTSNLEDMVNERTSELEKKTAEVEKINCSLEFQARAVKQDIEIARKLQNSIMPLRSSFMNDLEILVDYYPLNEIGGDIYDYNEIYPGYYRVFLGDAVGHGVSAAFITMLIKSEYEKLKSMRVSPSEINNFLNQLFFRYYYDQTILFTSVIVDIDFKKQKIIYSSAGHPVQYYIGPSRIQSLQTEGKPIGLSDQMNFGEIEIPMDRRFKLFLYTDGLTEEFNRIGSEFGQERLYSLLEKYKEMSVHDFNHEILRSVFDYLDDNSQNDDITLLTIGR